MSFRIEEKLFFKPENLNQFREFLTKNYAKKLFQKRLITSLYFDNLNLDMYRDSVEGSVPRKKIRIRHYPETEDINYYLEVKTSSVEGRYKTRKKINKNDFDTFTKNGILDCDYGTCLPNFLVSYEREYVQIKDVRISIDKKIVKIQLKKPGNGHYWEAFWSKFPCPLTRQLRCSAYMSSYCERCPLPKQFPPQPFLIVS